ncbi:MAG TPA: hypothetical protein VGM74_16820 [Burkholderiaceae bacterium]|jgi:hypothetical protein
MAHADEAALKQLLPLLRQLREIKGLKEMRPGTFHQKGSLLLQFHEEAGALFGDLKRSRGGVDRYPVDTPVGQRKLLDDAKRRVDRGDDE